MGHHLGADTGLIGESAATDANQYDAQSAAANGGGLECLTDDIRQHPGYCGQVADDNPQGHGQVDHDHGGQGGDGNPGHPGQAAENDRTDQYRQQQSGDRWRPAGGLSGEHGVANQGGKLVGLKHGQGADQSGQGKQHRQGIATAGQCLADDVHGPALELAQAVPAPIHDAQGAGEKFGGDTDDRGHPHPEHRSGATRDNGQGDAGNIAKSHGIGEGGGQGLLVGQFPGAIGGFVTPPQNVDGVAQMTVGQGPGPDQEHAAPAQ